MERWTLTMIRHRWVVVAVWVVVFLVSGIAASGLSALLTNRFSIPGSDTAKAEKILRTITSASAPTAPSSSCIRRTRDKRRPKSFPRSRGRKAGG